MINKSNRALGEGIPPPSNEVLPLGEVQIEASRRNTKERISSAAKLHLLGTDLEPVSWFAEETLQHTRPFL